jgi:outer membrane protein assembly factor BamE
MAGHIVHEPGVMSALSLTRTRAPRAVMLAALLAGLSACSSFERGTRSLAEAITFYKPEVVQGNFVSKEQVAALQPGMTRLQVRDLLGTPLTTSLFHSDRWDYVFTMKRQGVDPQNYHLVLFFHDGTLERFNGDEMPSETEFVQRISRERKVKVPVLQASEEQLAHFPLPAASAPESAASAPEDAAQPPAGGYPPLEAAAR